MINTHWLELSLSRTYFHGSKGAGAIEVLLYLRPFQIAERARNHGIGRHSSEEIHKIGCDDIQAISTFLGSKPYLFGDTPTVVSQIHSSECGMGSVQSGSSGCCCCIIVLRPR